MKELTKVQIDKIAASGDLKAARRLLAIEGDVPLPVVAVRLKAALRACCVYKVKAGGLVYTKHAKDTALDLYWKALQSMLEQLLQSHSEQAITLGTRLMVEAIKSECDIAGAFPLELVQATVLSVIINVYDPDYAAAVLVGELANAHWDVYLQVLSYLKLVSSALDGVDTSNTRPVITAIKGSGVDTEEILERLYTLLEAYAPPTIAICQTEPLDTSGKATCKGLPSLRRAFQDAWLTFLRLDLSTDLLRLVLRHLPSNVLPYLPSPQYLGDFYLKAFDGSDTAEDTTNSVLALSGLFYLLTQANIGDPSYIDNSLSAFYSRLYALLTPTTLTLPYRHRFLRLLLLALKSPMLPGASVAAFAKKLLRCAMLRSIREKHMLDESGALVENSVLFVVGIGRLERRRHTGCMLMAVVDARLEEDPWKAEMSLDEAVKVIPLTSLWELECLLRHHSPSVYRLAQLFRTNMFAETAKRVSPDDMLVVTDRELFDREVNYQCKRGRIAPPASIGFIREEVQPIYQAADEVFAQFT
ncbi:Nucleolar complex protein 4 [Perkinsus chesapeaki]|uniref:Nucleolar complex protein 4 n=1 Tax=Perkinsus chesapeaki TaxID=330153 RepID=A0A7J6MYW9_PERCH|nr:Nucleolar complex protein 4 [Perkinsus chesapeaki]